ncbi:hypothetical protein ORJ66_21035 [Pseudoalteromonas tunicata]|uniref:phosphatidylinositol-specific phospholipase C domain-containing protein n=1 Tax=Pseudoalteromonas tunicata TaxID=314281 RepID=UPI0027402902|nr:phosphatidylinositol-specific phospholipase C domain-containing protein [Pseudoalteromonas tunicata]MDP5215533.1 hypothetical protein [Pseudoalteromonas tunicata]
MDLINLPTKNWMSKLPDNIKLNEIVIPGCHDAGMGLSKLRNCSIGANDDNTKTQNLDILAQLYAGARYFDIRVDFDNNELVTFHRTGVFGCNGQTLKSVLQQMTSFLEDYKSETAILKISHIRSNNKATKLKISDLLLSYQFKDMLFKGENNNLAYSTLSELKGKIVTVLDYDEDIEPSLGLFRFHDGFVKGKCEFRGLNLTVGDSYSNTAFYEKMKDDQIEKWNRYSGLNQEYLFLLSWTLTAGVGANGSIKSLAQTANEHLANVLAEQDKAGIAKPNIVYVDYYDEKIGKTIISQNTSLNFNMTTTEGPSNSNDSPL